jgi:hypothetical protein
MVTIVSLWLAILLSAVVVWIASAIIWTVLPHHKSDYKGLPDEAAARAALKPQNLAPGQYNIPHVSSQGALKEPEVRQRFEEGPVGFITILPKGIPSMGKSMVLSFVYYLIISVFVAYLAGRVLTPGTAYLSVFRVCGTVAWLAYGWGVIQDAIWFGRPWSGVIKHLIDTLVYALLTAGMFGWLWPA